MAKSVKLPREEHRYFKRVRSLLEPVSGTTLIDVGNGGTELITYGKFRNRVAIDPLPLPEREGVVNVVGKWPHVTLPMSYYPADVITCLQVIEHLPDNEIEPFVECLFDYSRSVVISVPYKWRGPSTTHPQDPIDEVKFSALIPHEPLFQEVVTEKEGPQRIVAVFPGARK